MAGLGERVWMTPGLIKDPEKLLQWFANHGIAYPWGNAPSPYAVWVSEVMLQQTVVKAVVNHYKRWMSLFPNIASLAAAGEQEVLKAWEGLGYYSRGRNLLKGARYLVENHGGALPQDYRKLVKVPGIGDYTARAILSIAYGESYPVLDANVRRIAQRLGAKTDWTSRDGKELLAALGRSLPPHRSGEFNCALMQLGQQLCKTSSPRCNPCPLQGDCLAFKQNLQGEIPPPKKRKSKKKETSLALLVWENKILLTQRQGQGIGQGLWFIPALQRGTEEQGERSLEERIQCVWDLPRRVHHYTFWQEGLTPRLFCLSPGVEPFPPSLDKPPKDPLRWVPLAELESYPCPSVYRAILDEMIRILGSSP